MTAATSEELTFAQKVSLDPELWRAYLLGVEHGRATGWLAGYDYRNATAWAAAGESVAATVGDKAWPWEVAR